MPYNERNPGACDTGASGNNQAWQTDNSPGSDRHRRWLQYGRGLPVGTVVLVRGLGSGSILAQTPHGYIVGIHRPIPGLPTYGIALLVTDRTAIERMPTPLPARLIRQVWP